MSRWNPEGLRPDQLAWALTRPDIVQHFKDKDSCMLCLAPNVNEAGLCRVCTGQLDGDERKLVERWRAGVGP